MAAKPQVQSFTQSWNKTVNWAKQNNIPYQAYYPVYQMDSQKFVTSGQGMSESERIRAIEAASNLSYSTALPTDNPDWANIVGNSKKNATSIFTGLEPTHIIPNVLDTIKNTIAHPSDILGAIGDLFTGNLGAASKQILKPNNILDWVPGVYDLATVFNADPNLSSGAGGKALAENPLTTLLDVIPFGRLASEGLGRTALAESTATRAGLTVEEMRKLGIWRVGGKLIKTAPIPNSLTKEAHPWITDQIDPATGNKTPTDVSQQLTIGEFWTHLKDKLGAGAEQADISEERIIANREGTKVVTRILKPAMDSLDKLKPPEYQALLKWARTETRPLSEVMSDDAVPRNLRDTYEQVWTASQTLKQLKMQAGEGVNIPTPWGTVETYYVQTSQFRAVQSAFDQSLADQTALDTAKKPLEVALYKMDENDRNMSGVFTAMDQARSQLYDSIKASIPQPQHRAYSQSAGVEDRLAATLPGGERWDRSVSTQTPMIRNLFGLRGPDKLTLHMVNAVRDLFSPGGLLDQANKAFQQQDWVTMNKTLRAAVRKFNTKSFDNIPKSGRATLYILKRMTENLQKYAAERIRVSEEVNKRATGYYKGARLSKFQYRKSIAYLSEQAAKSHQAWVKAAIHNPPDVWRNVAMDVLTEKLAQQEKTAAAMESTVHTLSAQGWKDSELTKIRQDPRTMIELMTNEAKGSLENQMLPDVDHEESIRVTEDGYQYLASLRARGHEPLYIPELTTHDIEHGSPTYNVYIRGSRAPKPGSSFAKTWGYTPTIYDIRLGLLKGTKDIVEHDMMQHFIDQELMPRLYDAGDIQRTIRNYYSAEIAALAQHVAEGGAQTETALSVIERGLEKFNLEAFDPKQFFGEGFSHPTLSKPYYINKDLSKAFKSTINQFQFPAQSIVDRGTQIFRFSILGLSPRYTAHILFGGTFLVALRANPSIVKFLPQAINFALHGSFSEKTLSRLPRASQFEVEFATEEGLAAAQYHYVAMNSAGRNWLIPEWMARHSLPDTYKSRVRAALELNMQFTRTVVKAQQAAVYLDGAARALKEGTTYYADELVPRQTTNANLDRSLQTDAQGRNVYHPVTGRRIHDTIRSKHPMTPAEAHNEGMQAVAAVMGNLKHMTLLERNLLTRVFPFYGWTKHILKYVLSYPFDHPYRANILSQIAMQNSADVASGLPLRIQLLTFLGTPDQYGNVTAIDTKALDPLRDTANYASWTGLFESLNPAITGFGAIIDPQFSFAGQNLYPQITFNSLYGVNTAGAGGNLYNAAEQFVPQLTGLDEAFNLSGQYAYLKTSDPSAFSKKIFESFGLPFTPQQLNLRQIAARQEIDRYKQASQATYEAATTGDLSHLAGYAPNAELPDPLNTEYNVTPEYIAAMTQQSEQKYGLPWYATATPPPNPPL